MMSEDVVLIEEMLDVVSLYGRGDINLWEAVLRMQKAGSMMTEEEIIDALATVDRQNVVTLPRREE
jgi:hypothetical protein